LMQSNTFWEDQSFKVMITMYDDSRHRESPFKRYTEKVREKIVREHLLPGINESFVLIMSIGRRYSSYRMGRETGYGEQGHKENHS